MSTSGPNGPPAEPPADITSLLGVERARLSELLSSLDRADWDRPTPCPGWTVLGLCCHLVGDDLSLLSRQRDDHHGTRPPADAGEDDFISWLDGLQAEWVSAARRLSPRLATDLLGWAGPQLVETFRRQDPRARTAVVSWAGPGLVPVWLDQVREVSEYWIHRQQLLQALGRRGDLRADLTGPILTGLRWAYPFRLGQVRAQPGDTVTIEVSGPVPLTWQLVAAAPAGWEYRDLPGTRVVASLSVSTEQAWRLLTNNLPAAEQTRLALSGDPAITGVLRQTRAIIGTPQ
jgi:uncharacterized protein (TIGR03083 family)